MTVFLYLSRCMCVGEKGGGVVPRYFDGGVCV